MRNIKIKDVVVGCGLAGLMFHSGMAMAGEALTSFGDIDFGDGAQVVSSVNVTSTTLSDTAGSGFASASVLAGHGADSFAITRLSGAGGSVGIGGGWVDAIKLTGVASGQVLLTAHVAGDVDGTDGDFSIHFYLSSTPVDIAGARNALIADDVDPSVPSSARIFGLAKSNLVGASHYSQSYDTLATMTGGQTYYLVGLYSGDFSGVGGAAGTMSFTVSLDSVVSGTGGHLLRGAAAVSSVPEVSVSGLALAGMAVFGLMYRGRKRA